MSELELYFLLKLDTIVSAAGILAFLTGFAVCAFTIAFFVFYADAEEHLERVREAKANNRPVYSIDKMAYDIRELSKRMIKRILPFFIIFCLIRIAVPTTKEMVIIKVLPKVLANEQIQELPDNVLEFINGWLKEYTPVKENLK